MKKLLQVFFVAFATVSFIMAQVPVVETFDYTAGAIDGQGAAENGWGAAWTIVGPGDNNTITAGSLEYTGLTTAGNKLVVAAQEGAATGSSRALAAHWPDSVNDYWISYLVEIVNPTSIDDSWQGFSLDLGAVGTERAYFGKLWGQPYLGINDPDPYMNAPSSYAWSMGKAWVVGLLAMSGDDAGERFYMWVNQSPDEMPDTSAALVKTNFTFNEGFDMIRVHCGQTLGITVTWDEIRLGVAYTDVTTATIGIKNNERSENLVASFPNPFTDYVNISYKLYAEQAVKLEIYNAVGQKVETLVNDLQSQGDYNVQWITGNQPAGIYYYKLQIGNSCETGRLIHR